ncbi:TetR/AcrR family transcriptional regulator [Nocardia neocaledoniensis]|uniref:TetR/AcrR family transcriptional regulator n=1 Tax=Nocardia neocaledoniensis TaxID=236511 RepID=UPI002458645C|nr:TetR/AcrR family transcriptional regulator [Nocardia neocaledoniensis]
MVGDVRSRLIAATAEIIDQRGPLAVRIDEVAELAGCSRATVYRHVSDKDELVREVLMTRTAVMAGIVAHQIEHIADPLDRIAQGMLLFSDALRSEHWFKALQAHGGGGPSAMARVGGGLEAMTAALTPMLEALLRDNAEAGYLYDDIVAHDAIEWLIGIQLSLLEPHFQHPREHRLAMLKRYAIFPLIKPRAE